MQTAFHFEQNAGVRAFDPPRALSEAQVAGQLLIVGLDGTALDTDLAERLARISPGGIVLFSRNLVSAEQVATFCRELASALPIPPFLAIDQEGGRVSRLRELIPAIPPNLVLARSGAAEALVREHARHTGAALRLLGFNLNFAPVLDLSDESQANGIGDRAYGDDPARVARLAGLFLSAQGSEGVLGCGKHFPGLGGGRIDSHLELPVIPRTGQEIWEKDLYPYRALGNDCPLVMVGHAYYPALQGNSPRPASLSRPVVGDLLRTRLGYRGVILTDDLEMGAVDPRRSPGDVVLEALDAGHDQAMYCKSWDKIEEAHAALSRALRTGRLVRSRVDESLSRVLALKSRLAHPRALPPFDPGPWAEACQGLGRLEQNARA